MCQFIISGDDAVKPLLPPPPPKLVVRSTACSKANAAEFVPMHVANNSGD